MKNISERDKKHLWHPLTQHKLHPESLAVTRAKGAVLYDENDKTYIDGIASWYTCVYGHCNDFIIQKAYEQMQRLDHVVFSGFTHEPAVALSEALMDILPDNQEKLFFSDNGSTASDVAIKMALQYHFNRGTSEMCWSLSKKVFTAIPLVPCLFPDCRYITVLLKIFSCP